MDDDKIADVVSEVEGVVREVKLLVSEMQALRATVEEVAVQVDGLVARVKRVEAGYRRAGGGGGRGGGVRGWGGGAGEAGGGGVSAARGVRANDARDKGGVMARRERGAEHREEPGQVKPEAIRGAVATAEQEAVAKRGEVQEEQVKAARELPPGTYEVEPGVRVERREPSGVPVVRVATEPGEVGVGLIDERPGPGGPRGAAVRAKIAELKESGGDAAVVAMLEAYLQVLAPTGGPRTMGPNPKDSEGNPQGEPEPETPIPAPVDPSLAHPARLAGARMGPR